MYKMMRACAGDLYSRINAQRGVFFPEEQVSTASAYIQENTETPNRIHCSVWCVMFMYHMLVIRLTQRMMVLAVVVAVFEAG